jgi:hypothetical protein
MKLLTTLGLATAALVLAGSAGAQDHGGVRGQYPQDPYIGGSDLGRAPSKRIIPMSARNDVGLRCPADKVKLCGASTTELSAYRCLIFHRAKLSTACQHAVDELTPAYKGAL